LLIKIFTTKYYEIFEGGMSSTKPFEFGADPIMMLIKKRIFKGIFVIVIVVYRAYRKNFA